MDNQNKDDPDIDDGAYDDVLGDSFEDDLDDDFDDMDLDDDFEDEITLDENELLDEEPDDEWNDGEDDMAGLGAQKEKKTIDLSFNAMAIIGALVVGVAVLVFQVVTTKPKVTVDTFTSALNMSGASDGPIFGGEEVETAEIEKSDTEALPDSKGFLYEPDVLDSMDMEIKDTPPMPTPITSENPQESGQDTSMTEMPAQTAEVNPVEDVINQDNPMPVPRTPEDAEVMEPVMDIQPTPEPVAEKTVTALDDGQNNNQLPKAEDFLKSALDARRQKQKEEAQKMVDAVSAPTEKTPSDDNPVLTEMPEPVKEPEKEPEKTAEKQAPAPESLPMQMEQSASMSASNATQLEKKLDMIVGRIESMEMEIQKIREGGDSRIEDISEQLEGLQQELGQVSAKPAPAKQTTQKKVAAAPKAEAPKPAAVKKQPVKKAAAPAKWELRAAQPGKAWVAKKGQKSMQPVVVGDTLAGIGRINAITYDGRKWVVQGTQGQILQ